MTIINTTFHVDKRIEAQFCEWVRAVYVPGALSSTLLSDPCFSRIMIEVQDDCSSFAVSFRAASVEKAVEWHDSHGADLRRDLHSKFGERALFFSTYMEELPL